MKNIIANLIKECKQNIPGFIAISITEIKSGVAYESLSTKKDFDPSLASAYNLEVVKAKMNALKALGLKETVEEIAVHTGNQIHLIEVSDSGIYFIYLALDRSKANLGITRALLNKYKAELNSTI